MPNSPSMQRVPFMSHAHLYFYILPVRVLLRVTSTGAWLQFPLTWWVSSSTANSQRFWLFVISSMRLNIWRLLFFTTLPCAYLFHWFLLHSETGTSHTCLYPYTSHEHYQCSHFSSLIQQLMPLMSNFTFKMHSDIAHLEQHTGFLSFNLLQVLCCHSRCFTAI